MSTAGGGDPSLIPKLNGKVLVIKDFTTILGMHQGSKEEIFSQLRDVYDGSFDKQYGNGIRMIYKSKFGILAGVTPAIDGQASLHASMGERFLKFRTDKDLSPVSEEERILKAMSNINQETGMRRELQHASEAFLANKFNIDIKNASTWHPTKSTGNTGLLSIEEINLNLRILKDMIYTSPSREGLVPLLENVEKYSPLEVFVKEQKPTMSEKARPYIDVLMWGIMSGDLEAIKRSAGSILGLGPGLTPSCDDFLAGLMLSLNTAGVSLFKNESSTLQFFSNTSEEISALARGKTTIYSQSFLSEAALGEGPKTVLDLIFSIITKSTDQVAEISKRVIGVGATSGADISIGIYYGIRFLTSRIELRNLNEF
ncbi:MAG: DUF2877 domain-containing protein [Bacteroidetes bacterium]|nr:DUF2877 domain-containing protein [Bacteroidota bacterium]